MQFTVEQFTVANSVEKPVAYGFLRFLSERGLATETKTPKVPGRRGKPSTIYTLTDATVSFLGDTVKPYVPETVEVKTSTVAEQVAA